MRPYYFTLLVLMLALSSCKKKVNSDYHPHSSEYPYSAKFTYYTIEGVLTDSLGTPINGKAVYIEGPCFPYSITNSMGEFSFKACEMEGKWSYQFGKYFTVKIKDTTTLLDIAETDFLTSCLVKDGTVEIKIKLPS